MNNSMNNDIMGTENEMQHERREKQKERKQTMQFNKKVLIAEENGDFLKTLINKLRSAGYECRAVNKDGAELLKTASAWVPDVVITEAFMAHYDALAVLKLLPTLGLARRPAVVVLANPPEVAAVGGLGVGEGHVLIVGIHALGGIDEPLVGEGVAQGDTAVGVLHDPISIIGEFAAVHDIADERLHGVLGTQRHIARPLDAGNAVDAVLQQSSTKGRAI